jgi:hypothetical protein
MAQFKIVGAQSPRDHNIAVFDFIYLKGTLSPWKKILSMILSSPTCELSPMYSLE